MNPLGSAPLMVLDDTPRRTIGGKLNRLVVVSLGTALLVGTGLSCWGETRTFVQSKREVLVATAQVFASATSKAVAAGDAGSVLQALRAVARVPGLVHAEVRGPDGNLLAEVGTVARLSGDLVLADKDEPSPLALLTSRTLTLNAPIVDGGLLVGRIELVSETTGIMGQLWGTLVYALLGSAAALVLGLALAFRLQRSIAGPIEALTVAMTNVEQNGAGGDPVAVVSDDETGILAARFNSMISEMREATDRILAREKEVIERLGRAGEMRDDQTGQHVIRVARVSRIIASELGLAPAYIDNLCRASPMHDVGKISIRDAVLHKPGPLDAEERREMEQHARRGFEILDGSNSQLVQLAAEIALSHHERWDGNGYPNKVAGPAIPLSGRITAVADVCDALLSERPYKKPWPLDRVRDLLTKEAGAHFDPDCVNALLARWHELQAVYPNKAAVAAAA
jgi:putative two-component system response regulator